MRRRVAQLVVLMTVAVVAGLLGVQGAWALWSAYAPSGAGTVRAADFRVELNGTPMAVDGVATTLTLQGASALTPSAPIHATVTVANATNASAPLQIEAVMGAATISAGPSSQGMADALSVESTVAPAQGDCTAVDYSARSDARIAQGDEARFCVRISLPRDAATSLQNQTAIVTIPVTATQIAQGS